MTIGQTARPFTFGIGAERRGSAITLPGLSVLTAYPHAGQAYDPAPVPGWSRVIHFGQKSVSAGITKLTINGNSKRVNRWTARRHRQESESADSRLTIALCNRRNARLG